MSSLARPGAVNGQDYGLLNLPPELLHTILSFATEYSESGRKDVVSCAKTCQHLFDVANPILLGSMSGINLARMGRGQASSVLYDITGAEVDKDTRRLKPTWMSASNQVLSLHLRGKDYDWRPDHIERALRHLAFSLRKAKVFQTLTVTPSTVFYTREQFRFYTDIARNQAPTELVYLPSAAVTTNLGFGEPAYVSAWLQTEKPPILGQTNTGRKADLFIESGALLLPASTLFADVHEIHGLTFVGNGSSDGASITNLCRVMGIEEKTRIDSLRFVHLKRLPVSILSKPETLQTLTALELHDISTPDGFLRKASLDTVVLKRLTITYSGHPACARLAPLTAKVVQSLLQIIRQNASLTSLCIHVKNFDQLTPATFISILPPTLELLHVATSTEDFFDPDDYLPLARQCPKLRGLGVTMHFVTSHEVKHLYAYSKARVKNTLRGVRNMTALQYLTIITFIQKSKYKPLHLAKFIYQLGDDLVEEAIKAAPNTTPPREFGPIMSIHRRQQTYKAEETRAMGDHYRIVEENGIDRFTPDLQSLVRDLRYIAGLFGRSMAGFAAADGVRYRFKGPQDLETQVGWSKGSKSLVEV